MNCDNTARIPNQVQSDIDTVFDDNDADNNECDPDFSIPLKVNDTKMQCDYEYHKAGVEVLDQIMEKFNVSKSLRVFYGFPGVKTVANGRAGSAPAEHPVIHRTVTQKQTKKNAILKFCYFIWKNQSFSTR